MRIAIFSDIHSNIEALTEVLKVIESQKVDRVVSLGDVVGYGASPNPCCELIRDIAEVTLLGNHDAAVAGRMDYSFYYDAARHALDWSANVITDENLAWLRSLPYTYRIGDVGFCHGSPIERTRSATTVGFGVLGVIAGGRRPRATEAQSSASAARRKWFASSSATTSGRTEVTAQLEGASSSRSSPLACQLDSRQKTSRR